VCSFFSIQRSDVPAFSCFLEKWRAGCFLNISRAVTQLVSVSSLESFSPLEKGEETFQSSFPTFEKRAYAWKKLREFSTKCHISA
jgi:hypothetical protein